LHNLAKDPTIIGMLFALKVTQIVIAVLLMGLILIQSKGVGLGSTFGGGEVYFARRGAEKILFVFTIVISILFITSSVVNVWLN